MGNTAQRAAITMSLKSPDDEALAAANLKLTFSGRIEPGTLAFEFMKEKGLVSDTGMPTFDLDDTLAALSLEINRRIESGEWNG